VASAAGRSGGRLGTNGFDSGDGEGVEHLHDVFPCASGEAPQVDRPGIHGSRAPLGLGSSDEQLAGSCAAKKA
jgi:hypothetical protein